MAVLTLLLLHLCLTYGIIIMQMAQRQASDTRGHRSSRGSSGSSSSFTDISAEVAADVQWLLSAVLTAPQRLLSALGAACLLFADVELSPVFYTFLVCSGASCGIFAIIFAVIG